MTTRRTLAALMLALVAVCPLAPAASQPEVPGTEGEVAGRFDEPRYGTVLCSDRKNREVVCRLPLRRADEQGASDAARASRVPWIAQRRLYLVVEARPDAPGTSGVILAQGGHEHGYAIHLVDGRPAFDVRVDGEVTRLIADQPVKGLTKIEGWLDRETMRLAVDGLEVAETPSPGLIPAQPKDAQSVGRDDRTAAGDYAAPNPLAGTVMSTRVEPWTDYLTVPKPLFADPNYHGSCDPEVVWNEAAGEWFVYYTARRATREKGTYVGTPLGVLSSPNLADWTFRGYCSFDGKQGRPDNDDTHWAPGILAAGDWLHMFATYKDNATPPWGGKSVIRHYRAPLSDPVDGWTLVDVPDFTQPDPIDVSLLKVGDEYRAYYRVRFGGVHWATSDDLTHWSNRGPCPGDVNAEDRGFDYQEAPYVFRFGDWYWMLTDPHDGLAVFRSPDAVTWTQTPRILKEPGTGAADGSRARHPSVAVVDGRALLFYHVEPNRPYPTPPAEKRTVKEKISFLQVAELRIEDDRLTCDRNATVRLPGEHREPSGPAPRPAMSRQEIEAGLKSHDRALYVKEGWIRDPFITRGPDDYFYLTGTTPMPGDVRETLDPYNTGLGEESIVGYKAQVWRSRDLVDWEWLGTPFGLTDGIWYEVDRAAFESTPVDQWRLWAPELHWLGDRWALVHTSPSPVAGANLALSAGAEVARPWRHPMGAAIGRRHDPSLFHDDDGTWWLIWGATTIAPLKSDFTDFAAKPTRIGPSGATSKMGHEGCLIHKIHGKYVLFGTGWSTHLGRRGSYNLYYATADEVTGPYSERMFVGRFLGHGTPFQDRQGRWWCTAFYNGNVPPDARGGIESRDLSDTAHTINQRGTTLVPLDVRLLDDGHLWIRAKDSAYATPGPDEAQRFDK